MDMAKKFEKQADKRLKEIIKEAVQETLNEIGQLDEMARVGYVGGEYEVYVRTNDGGNIPHVHIRDTNTQGNLFETCVELERNRYFLHGNIQDTLSQKECKAFNRFMHEEMHSRTFNGTMYEFAVDMWNKNNSHVNIDVKYDTNDKPIIPDYTTIELNK